MFVVVGVGLVVVGVVVVDAVLVVAITTSAVGVDIVALAVQHGRFDYESAPTLWENLVDLHMVGGRFGVVVVVVVVGRGIVVVGGGKKMMHDVTRGC